MVRPRLQGEEDSRDAAYRGGTPSVSSMSSITTQNPSETSARGERQDVEEGRERRTIETLPIEEAHHLNPA
jgi:hypothetical protein